MCRKLKNYIVAFFIFNCFLFSSTWTVMIYLDGDNDLEEFAIQDFLEIAEVGSDENINIVIQFDRTPGYDRRYDNWTECNRFYITYGMIPTRANSIKDWGDGIGGREVNMGDPKTLLDFINWVKKNYPAEKYMLILWNHGTGWKTVDNFEENYKKRLFKGICYDSTSSDHLTLKELREALSESNINFEIIGFDACLMGMIEVASEIKDFANFFIASQISETIDGWNYKNFLFSLKKNPSATPIDIIHYIIDSTNQETLSGISLKNLNVLNQKLNEITNLIINSKDYLSVFLARNEIYTFNDDFVDLYNFFETYFLYFYKGTKQDLFEQFRDAFSKVVIYDNNLNDKFYGLSIYFPSYFSFLDPFYNENNLIFCSETLWDEFLKIFFNSNIFEGYKIIFSEDFTKGLSSDWEVIDGYNDGYTWMVENPKKRTSSYLVEPFMIVDSDWAGYRYMDEQLISPSFNFLNYKKIFLKFTHKLWYYSEEIADLDIKIEDSEWQNLKRWQKKDEEGVIIIDISDIVRNKNNVKFRWHYYNAYFDWFWAIDNIEILIKEREKGDINGDLIIDITDVILCLRMVVLLDDKNLEYGDINEDGDIDITDVILILKKTI